MRLLNINKKEMIMNKYNINNFKDFLFNLYYVKNMSSIEMADMLNVGSTTINTWLHKNEIPTKRYKKENKYIKKDNHYDIELYNYFGEIEGVAKIIIEDYSITQGYIWRVSSEGYVFTHKNGKTVFMHRLILKPSNKEIIDHENHDKLDNRRENIRIATKSTNAMNVKKWEHNKSGIIGVNFRKDTNKWRAYIKINQKQITLGSYDIKEDAIIARLKAEKQYFREFAPQKHLYNKYLKGELDENK